MPDAGIELKRVVDLVTQSEVDSGVYTLIDSVSGAVKKYPLGSFIASVAPIFDATAAYSAGDYCNYNGQIYRFTADHAAGSWTGSDATAVNVGEELTDLKAEINNVLSEDLKQALLQIAMHVVYVDEHGQDYYDELENALYTPADLVSISAVYTQSGTVYDTDTLDSLKSDLVVTAHMSDTTTRIVTRYTLSGTLTVGESTISVVYEGKTTTFTVTVSDHRQVPTDYTWLYEAKNGTLLRDDSYISFVIGSGTVTENISDDLLYIKVDGSEANAQYRLSDTTTTDATLSCRAKVLTGGANPEKHDGRCISLTLSNGSSGAGFNIWPLNDLLNSTTWTGNTENSRQYIPTNIPQDDFHIFEISLHSGVMALTIDGETIYTSSDLNAWYTTMNRFMVHNWNVNSSSVYVDWIAYKEN